MPFEIGDTIEKSVDGVIKNGSVVAIMSNPFYTALLIVTVLVIIAAIVLQNEDDSLAMLLLRIGFWGFLSSSCVLLVHNKVYMNEVISQTKTGMYEENNSDEITNLM